MQLGVKTWSISFIICNTIHSPELCIMATARLRVTGYVITSYSIHYTNLYDPILETKALGFSLNYDMGISKVVDETDFRNKSASLSAIFLF